MAAGIAAAEVDDPVGLGDQVQVVFDHQHALAAIDQAVQHADEFSHVLHVQADSRFVQHIERVRRFPALTSSETSLIRCASSPDRAGNDGLSAQ
jgi:hypothetical protein